MKNESYKKIIKLINSKKNKSKSYKINNFNISNAENYKRKIDLNKIIEVKDKEIDKLNLHIDYLKNGIEYRDNIIREQNNELIKLKENLKKKKVIKKKNTTKINNKVENVKFDNNKNFEKIEIEFLIKNICENKFTDIKELYKGNKYIKFFYNILENEKYFSNYILNISENDVIVIYETFKIFNYIFRSISKINNNIKFFIKNIPKLYNLNFYKEQFDFIVDIICNTLNCDRATIFLYNSIKNEFWSQSAKNSKDIILVSADKGIIGEVYRQKKIINIKDVYSCKFFNNEIDSKENYQTKSVLAIPIIDENNNCFSIVQALNKNNDYFNKEDEGFLIIIKDFIKKFLENTLINNKYSDNNMYLINKFKSLLNFSFELNYKSDEISFYKFTKNYIKKFFDSCKCLFFFYENNKLYNYKKNLKKFHKNNIGWIGNCIENKKLITSFNTNLSIYYNSLIDINTSMPTLTYPIIHENNIIAIFQIQNLKKLDYRKNENSYLIDKYEMNILLYLDKFIKKGILNIK